MIIIKHDEDFSVTFPRIKDLRLAELIKIVQAIIIVMICIVSGKIVAAVIKCDEWRCISLRLILYGTLCLRSVKGSYYWYSASIAYVWPLLPLFGAIWFAILIQRKETCLTKYTAVF